MKMEEITNYTNYKINEAMVEVEETEDGVYVLSLQDIKDIVKNCSSSPNENGDIDDETILNELENYNFVKVEEPEISKLENEEELDELSSDDENPSLIKKLNELS